MHTFKYVTPSDSDARDPAFVGVVMPKRFPKWEPLSAGTLTASFR